MVMHAELSAISVDRAGHGDEKGGKKGDRQGGSGSKETGTSRKRVVNGAEGDRGWKKARK